MRQWCAKNLLAGLRLGALILPIRDLLFAGDINRSFDETSSPVRNVVRNSLQWCVPVDAVDNDYLLRILRRLSSERIRTCVQGVYDLFKTADLLAAHGIGQKDMKIVVTVFPISVRRSRSIGHSEICLSRL